MKLMYNQVSSSEQARNFLNGFREWNFYVKLIWFSSLWRWKCTKLDFACYFVWVWNCLLR